MTKKLNRRSVLQVGYYPSLLHTRQVMMEADGHVVTSALGNAQCKQLVVNNDFDVALVGFSGNVEERRDIIRWLKQTRPQLPVVALRTRSEDLPQADCALSAEDPQAWLAAVRDSR